MSENHLFSAIRAAIPAMDKPLARLIDGTVETYGDALALSARLANLLVARGVKPGDRVAVQVEKSWPALALYLGAIRAGAVYLPLNTAYTLNEVEYFLSDAEPTVFVCRPEIEQDARALAARLGVGAVETLGTDGKGSLTEAAASFPDTFADVARGPDDLGGILYTSGTTGRAKGAMLTHDNLLSNTSALKDYWRFTADDVLLHALPIFHTHGLFVATNIVLLSGASMEFRSKFDPKEAIALMAAGKVTTLMGVPTFYTRLLDQPGLTREATKACACSSPAPRRCWRRRIAPSRSAPATPSSSATA